MRKKNKSGSVVRGSDRMIEIMMLLLIIAFVIIVLYPLYYVVIASVSDPYDVYAGKTFLLPSGFTLEGYIIQWVQHNNHKSNDEQKHHYFYHAVRTPNYTTTLIFLTHFSPHLSIQNLYLLSFWLSGLR